MHRDCCSQRGTDVETAMLFLAEGGLNDTLHLLASEALCGDKIWKLLQVSCDETQRWARGAAPQWLMCSGARSDSALVPGKPWNVILSPGTAPLGGSRISTLSGELAHMTMAWDTTPLILAGFRLHIRTAMRFCICTDRRGNSFTASVIAKTITNYMQLALIKEKALPTDADGRENIKLQHKQYWPFQSNDSKWLCPGFMVYLPHFINQREQTGRLQTRAWRPLRRTKMWKTTRGTCCQKLREAEIQHRMRWWRRALTV